MKDETRHQLHRFFEENFEVSIDELSHDRLLVRPHPAIFAGYEGAYLLRNPHGYLLCVLPDWVDRVAASAASREAAGMFDASALGSMFGDKAGTVVGPATIAYADDTDFIPADAMGARLLTQDDAHALVRLREACDPIEWDHAGSIYAVQHPTFAVFNGEEIVAAASYDYQGDWIRHVGLITHPAYRHRGYGRAVASAITGYGLAEGGIMQWQTLDDNAGSVRIREALGYKPWVQTIAIRFDR